MPPAKMRGDGRKAKDPKKTFLRLLSYLRKYKLNMAIVVLCITSLRKKDLLIFIASGFF